MFELEHAIRGRSALVLHEATAAALAAIDGPALRQAAALMVQTAFFNTACNKVSALQYFVIKIAGGIVTVPPVHDDRPAADVI